MFVDASAILAILTYELEAQKFITSLELAHKGSLITSSLAVWETTVGLYRKKSIPMHEAEARIKEFIKIANIQVLPISHSETSVALQAFDRYGRHSYPDANRNNALNLADCFHYSCAKINQTPILTKDIGFKLTDLEAVGTDF
jgi:ribonuclease VapC